MGYALLANLVLAAHVAYVAFVVLGELVILLGILCRWNWVRNAWFRMIHLAAILIVAAEAVLGIECPLTRWEYQLRVFAGERGRAGSFMGELLQSLIFFDQPEWVLRLGHVAFALLVVATFVWAAPFGVWNPGKCDPCASRDAGEN